MAYRTDGMEYALRIVKEKGVEALEREVKTRLWSGISLRNTIEEINEGTVAIKQMTLDTVRIVTVMTLRDEFGFGKERMKRFLDRFRSKTEVLIEDYATWKDYQDIIRKELGFDLELRWNK